MDSAHMLSSFTDLLYVVGAYVTSLGGGAVIVFALSSWLGKLWANRIMAEERIKHDGELERLRAELRRTAFEHEVRFGRLHQTQAEVIAELYGKFIDYYAAGQAFLYGGAHVDPDKYEAFVKANQDLARFYERNRIYLPSPLCDQIAKFMSRTGQEVTTKFMLQDSLPISEVDRKDFTDRLMSRWSFVTDEMPSIRDALIKEFQCILGVKNDENV